MRTVAVLAGPYPAELGVRLGAGIMVIPESSGQVGNLRYQSVQASARPSVSPRLRRSSSAIRAFSSATRAIICSRTSLRRTWLHPGLVRTQLRVDGKPCRSGLRSQQVTVARVGREL